MTLYFDTSSPGRSAFTTPGTSTVKNFGADLTVFATVVSNFITGQATGAPVQLRVYSKRNGIQFINADYGQASQPTKVTGYLVELAIPGGASVNIRVVLSSTASVLTPITVAAVSQSTTDVNIKTVIGAPPNFAQETGGHLASVDSESGTIAGNTGTLASTVGTTPTTNKVTTQT